MTNWTIDALAELVSCESPSSDADATRRCGELFTALVRDRRWRAHH